jgi:hypothetical protein
LLFLSISGGNWETSLLHIALAPVTEALRGENHARELRPQFLDHLRRNDPLTYSVTFTVAGTKEPRLATPEGRFSRISLPAQAPETL